MKTTPHSCTLTAVGDIMLHGKIAEAIAESGDGLYPFRKILPALQGSDILFGNLETLTTRSQKPFPGTPGKYFSPIGTGKVLAEAGFKVVNLGHNHAYDWGDEGVETTEGELRGAGIAFAGLGKTSEAAGKPAFVTCTCGRRFGFLCYTGTYNTLNASHGYVGRPPSVKNFKADLARLKPQADVVVVSIHGGACLNDWPTPDMLKWCRQAVDAGANIVLGHHPHVFHGVEHYKQGIIAYSLPDIVRPFPFDSDEVYAAKVREKHESFILIVKIDSLLRVSYGILPCILDASLQTGPADHTEAQAIREKLETLSHGIRDGLSNEKHFTEIQGNFGDIYLNSLFRTFKKGGLPWLWQRLRTLRTYHFKLIWKGLAGLPSRKP